MSKFKINIGSRGSPLALAQVEEIKSLLRHPGVVVDFELKMYATQGDWDKTTPLSTNPADDFFTDALDEALLKGDIDCAVHSAKDLPQTLREGLSLLALTKCLDSTDSWVGQTRLAELPSGAKVGTSSLQRKTEVLKLNPGVEPVEIRGAIQERLKLIEDQKIAGTIVATCALKRLHLDHLIREIFPWETTPLQGNLAVVGRKEDLFIKSLFEKIDIRLRFGTVTLVGAGPGDPDLITLKGIKALNQADCVFYDYLVSRDLLEHAPGAQKIYAGKRKGKHTLPQNELSRMLREKAGEGKQVVRLKGGDPLIFGRGADEIAYLRSYHIPVVVIPGVSSATGIPSLLQVPLTARGISSSVAFVSGHENAEDQNAQRPIKIPDADTVIFLMGLTKLPMILNSLNQSGWDPKTPALIISKGTTLDEKIVHGTLNNLQELASHAGLEPPALIIVGETVGFFQNKKPVLDSARLENQILYLGTNPEKYQSLGPLLHWPMIEIAPRPFSNQEKSKLAEAIQTYDLILLTSRFAVKYFFDLIEGLVVPSELMKIQWAVIGKDTAAALQEKNIMAAVVGKIETSGGLLEALSQHELKGKRILFPRSALPNPFLKEELIKRGALVQELTVYENNKPILAELPLQGINRILFTSPSTVKNFIDSYGTIPPRWQILSKGPTTSEALKKAGYAAKTILYD